MFFPAVESSSRPPHSSGDTPQRPDALRAFSSSRLAAAFLNLPGGQGRFAPSATARFPFVGTADRPLLRARPRLTSPGARERPLPDRNTHLFPSAGDEGAGASHHANRIHLAGISLPHGHPQRTHARRNSEHASRHFTGHTSIVRPKGDHRVAIPRQREAVRDLELSQESRSPRRTFDVWAG